MLLRFSCFSNPWPPDADFHDLASLLKPTISLINPLAKTPIWEPWPPEPYFHDMASRLKPSISLLNPLIESSIWEAWHGLASRATFP